MRSTRTRSRSDGDQLLGHAHAGVGADEDLEEVVVEGVVEVAAQQHRVADLLAERQRGAVHASRHAPPPRLAMDAGHHLVRHRAEPLRPRRGWSTGAVPTTWPSGTVSPDSASKRTLITG